VSLTNLLILVNVVAFVWELATGGPDYDHGYLIGKAVVEQGQWWRIFTAAFLHGSLPHIALNMIALYQVGNLVEQLFGKVRFALLYTLSIVGSSAFVIYFNYDQPTLGASGAIFGLFGALVAVGLRLGKRGRALIGQVVPIVGLNLVFTFAVPGISAAAHVGGLITGFVVGFVLFMMPSPERERAYAYAFSPPPDQAGIVTIDQEPTPPLEYDETRQGERPPRPHPEP
jgi:membrane associated rhomboid family serine protease